MWNFIYTKPTASGPKNTKSRGILTDYRRSRECQARIAGWSTVAVCLKRDVSVDLRFRKAYQVITDHRAESDGQIRIIDESGEDYLYPASYFSQAKPLLVRNKARNAQIRKLPTRSHP